MSRRVEFVWPDELVARVDAARGDVPRSKFVQRALEKALGPTVGGVTASESPAGAGPAPPRASVEEEPFVVAPGPGLMPAGEPAAVRHAPKRRAKPAAGGLPSIAPRHWGGS